MPKAPQLERGRAGTHVQVCGAPASASAQPCMALGRFCFFCSPGPQPQWEGVVTGLQESGKWGPRGLIWPFRVEVAQELRPTPLASRGEGGLPEGRERTGLG